MSEKMPSPMRGSDRDRFVGEGIIPDDASFDVAAMATGAPGLPRSFSWRGTRYTVLEVLETWKESGDCHHGSGERYVRKHWFRVRTIEGTEMKIYFERQKRSSGGSRWRLFSVRGGNSGVA
jgi:phosphoribosylglycinamide formyltransferase-1